MAKYGRFDPRNKKNNRNKIRSILKEHRIHEPDESRKRWGNQIWRHVEEDHDQDRLEHEDW